MIFNMSEKTRAEKVAWMKENASGTTLQATRKLFTFGIKYIYIALVVTFIAGEVFIKLVPFGWGWFLLFAICAALYWVAWKLAFHIGAMGGIAAMSMTIDLYRKQGPEWELMQLLGKLPHANAATTPKQKDTESS